MAISKHAIGAWKQLQQGIVNARLQNELRCVDSALHDQIFRDVCAEVLKGEWDYLKLTRLDGPPEVRLTHYRGKFRD